MELITEQDYSQEIRSIIDGAYEAYSSQDPGVLVEPYEFLSEWLHTAIDGHQWVIHTYYNTQVLTHSGNEDAYWEEFGVGPENANYGSLMAVLAYSAMHADVMEHINMADFEDDDGS